MFTEELKHKYINHLKKAQAYDPSVFNELYDQFLSLFTGFNMLYNEVPEILRAQGITDFVENDSHKATTLALRFIGSDNLLKEIMDQNSSDLAELISVMEAGIFHIRLNSRGIPLVEQDEALLSEIKSEVASEKPLAVLRIIYSVRCNMIHGNKDIQEYQRLLLEPLSHLITTVNKTLFNELTKT